MNILHIITIKYLGATNTKGNRVKLIDNRFEGSITLERDYTTNSALDQAYQYLENQGLNIVGVGNGKDVDYIVLDSKNGTFTGIAHKN